MPETVTELKKWLTVISEACAERGDQNKLHDAFLNKLLHARGCICVPVVTVDEQQQPHWVHAQECGLPQSPADTGPLETGYSPMALALAGAISEVCADRTLEMQDMARLIDVRLAQIRQFYEPVELAKCPWVTHHPEGPCAFCLSAAMREFILVPKGVNS